MIITKYKLSSDTFFVRLREEISNNIPLKIVVLYNFAYHTGETETSFTRIFGDCQPFLHNRPMR
jgi:hypothetical protein